MLAPWRVKAKLATAELTALADRGYYSGEENKSCHDAGIVPLVPKELTSNSKAAGRYDKSDFAYDPQRDAFRCSAGEYAIRRFTSVEKNMAINKHWSSACPSCALKAKCTTATYRRIGRFRCRVGSMPIRRRCKCAGAQSSIRSERSRHGWEQLISYVAASRR